jgi:hypothetical protein
MKIFRIKNKIAGKNKMKRCLFRTSWFSLVMDKMYRKYAGAMLSKTGK